MKHKRLLPSTSLKIRIFYSQKEKVENTFSDNEFTAIKYSFEDFLKKAFKQNKRHGTIK